MLLHYLINKVKEVLLVYKALIFNSNGIQDKILVLEIVGDITGTTALAQRESTFLPKQFNYKEQNIIQILS